MKVGFIGLGTMGGGMALNIRKGGYDMVVHDINRDAAKRHIDAGCTWADSPKELGAQCDVVFTSLPGPPEVEAVAAGPNGLIEGMKQGSVWFDMSTNSPTVMRRLNAVFAAKGIDVLDTPVSGGPAGANSGKLAIWAGRQPRDLRPAEGATRLHGRSGRLHRRHRRRVSRQARTQLRRLRRPDSAC